MLLLLAACGAPHAADTASPPPKALPARALAEVFVLEAAGVQPDDTSLTLAPGEQRVIVLRRSAPDFGLFARIEVGDSTLKAPSGAPAAGLTIRPRSGEYALELLVQGTVGQGGTILFSYGSHFVAPAGARERYGSDIYFERELAIGRLTDDGQVVFLPTVRPGSDMLSATLPGPGRYLVAAPR
ncbi:MAG TPA: hypothetical protein VGQ73_08410 [Gemmatimonadales bacterium]|jgi:hypothetical protein|nr:hypothetical protein [Gemmatimonadales bacterium]